MLPILVIDCHIASYFKINHLKITHIYYLIVPAGQESVKGLAESSGEAVSKTSAMAMVMPRLTQ